MPLQRRTIAAAGLLAVAVLTACGAPTPSKPAADSGGDVPDKPSKAVTLNILDVAGNLQLTLPMIDDFVQQHHDVISKVTYSKAPAPELAGKIKAQQNANRVDIDLVLTGTDGLSAGQEQACGSTCCRTTPTGSQA
jgi:putative spermidine/putrescine transport system substrate-binding protein